MAYCKQCGAYIPDGQNKCLACGYDEQAEQAAAQAAAAQAAAYAEEAKAREQAAEETRAEVERRRAQRQEYNKAWAENEQRNRKMEEEFRRRRNMEEEFRRRQQQEKGGVHVFVDADGNKRVQVGDKVHVVVNADGTKKVSLGGEQRYEDSESDARYRSKTEDSSSGSSAKNTNESGKRGVAALSYLGLLLLIPLFAGQDDDYVKFHTKQGSKLLLATFIGNIIGGIFSFGWAVNIVALILAVMGIGNAVNGRKQELPVIGKWFKF